MKQPKPKTVKVVCEVCGLEWREHKPDGKGKVGLDECVRLLKAELAKRPAGGLVQWKRPARGLVQWGGGSGYRPPSPTPFYNISGGGSGVAH